MLMGTLRTTTLLLMLAGTAFAGNAAESYRRLYGEREKKALASATKDDDAKLAADLLAGAAELSGDADLRILLYEKAYEIGRRGTGGYRTALRALELLAEAAPERQSGCEMLRVDVLADLYRYRDGPAKVAAGEELVHERILLARRRIGRKDWATAKTLLWDAQVVAGRNDSARKEEANVLRKAVEQRIRRIGEARELAEKLKATPSDHAARCDLVRLCLVDLNDPALASEHLGPGVAREWAERIPLAVKAIPDLTEAALLTMGEWYAGLAEDAKDVPRRLMLMRCRDLLTAYVSRHAAEDESRLRAKLGIQEAEQAIFEVDGELVRRAGKSRWVDLLSVTDPARHAAKGRWVKDDRGLHSDGGRSSVVYFPVKVTGSYELQAFFVRHTGDMYPAFVTPAGEHGGMVMLGGWGGSKNGLHRLRGKGAEKNETTHLAEVVNGLPYRTTIRVDLDGKNVTVKVWLNGDEIISWRGRQEWFKVEARRPDRWLGMEAHRGRIELRSAKVRMIRGDAELVNWE